MFFKLIFFGENVAYALDLKYSTMVLASLTSNGSGPEF